MKQLKEYEKSITSQWGEDGVIGEIFKRIGETNRIVVDIGAWDGKHLSNTWSLAKKGWMRYCFEKNSYITAPTAFEKECFMTYEVDDIDSDLDGIPEDFDFLNIDVDGNDYWLWRDMEKFRPRVICIEYNQTVPKHIEIVGERGTSFGASYRSLEKLGIRKGYTLVHATVTNLIFVLRELWNYERCLWMPSDWVGYVVTGTNGKKYMIGKEAHRDNQGAKHEKLISDHEIVNL